MTDVDVLVIGSGAAGLAAATSAREHGAGSVLIAEAEDVVGGSSRLSGGLVMGAGTRFQLAQGIEDSGEDLFHHYMTLNRWAVDVGPVHRLSIWAGPTVDWAADHGVQFHPEVVFGGDETIPRVHVPVGGGQHVIDALRAACMSAGQVDIALGRRVDRLLEERGRVVGAAVGDDHVLAATTILATGGFGANPELCRRHFPSGAGVPGWWYIGAGGARGDALGLTDKIGAQRSGEGRGLRLVDPGFGRGLEAYLPGWLVLVDRTGRRFIDETAPYGILDNRVADRGDVAFAVFSHATISAETTGGRARYKHHLPTWERRQSPNWTREVVAEEVANGHVVEADTLEELAEVLGLPQEAFLGEMERYNDFALSGEDRDFLKARTFLDPLDRPPFYGAVLRPRTVCWTGYGPRIDADARVLDQRGRPIGGLLAAGECTGGILGETYVGSGNQYANCLVFGRIAGQVAAGVSPRVDAGPSNITP